MLHCSDTTQRVIMDDDNYDESSGDGEDDVGEWSSCCAEDAELSLPRVRASSVARGDGHDSRDAQHQHLSLQNATQRSPTSPTYSLCGSRLRWINSAEQLLLGVPHSHSLVHALSVPHQTNSHLYNGKAALSRRQFCHRDLDTRHSNQISFLSVAHFPPGTIRRDFECALRDKDRIFVTDPTKSSSPSSSTIKTQELSSCSQEFSRSISDSSVCCDKSDGSSSERFTSHFAMPVPESFRSTWSIQHVPSLHISASPEKVKKLKELRRDDNYNIEEVTESEVPASRLYSGLRNGNGHIHHDDFEELPEDIQSLNRQPQNAEYTESVSISRIPAHQEYRYGVRYDIDNSRRYRDEVRLVPGQTNPGRYYSTLTQCFINSPYRRYKETVYIQLHAPNPKQYSSKVFIFPKSVRETFVSEVDHHDEKRIKWYKVGVNMEARDYVSVKFMQVN